jgi:SEC-C motif-containing protein
MRSRYTAYTQANIDYIANTMQGPASHGFDAKEALSWAKAVKWLGLDVVTSSHDGDQGTVEFIANYSHDGLTHRLHEISQFHRVDNQWYYIEGHGPVSKPITRATPKLSRNDPCSCGSQKKFKKCCGKESA